MNGMTFGNPLLQRVFMGSIVFGLGILLGMRLVSQNDSSDMARTKIQSLREGEGTYTNHLLLCEVDGQGDDPAYDELKNEVKRVIGDSGVGRASVYFRNLTDGAAFGVHPDERYIPASLNKVPLMIKIYENAESDPNYLNTKIVRHDLQDANAVQVLQPESTMKAFAQYSMQDAVELMIRYSDNNAYNALTERIPYDTYMELFDVLQIPTDYEAGITASEYSYFLRVLYNTTILSQESSEIALGLMTEVSYEQGLRAGVPVTVEIAHKFGTSGEADSGNNKGLRQLHDCGIVYAPGKPYLLCVMTEGKMGVEKLGEAIAEVSKVVWENVSEKI